MLADEAEVVLEAALDVRGGRVVAVAVGAFRHERVHALHGLRVAQERRVALPEVAREEQAAALAPLVVVERDGRRPEDVPGVVEGGAQAGDDLARLAVGQRPEERHRVRHVLEVVEQLEGLLALLAARLVHVLHVARLEERAVAQHHFAQVARGGRGVDRAAVAGLHERRDAAAVVDVRVGEDDRVDLLRRERHRAVRLERLLAVALQQAAVHEDAMAVVFDRMERAGGGAGGADEAEVEHGGRVPFRSLGQSYHTRPFRRKRSAARPVRAIRRA